MSDRECVELLQAMLPRVGLRWRGFSNVRGQVCKRLGRRARELGLDARAYRARLESDAAELERFDAFCRVTISRFYRDRAVFDLLAKELLPGLLAAGKGRQGTVLRCWSAGCASGEEPYSLALVLQLALKPKFPDLRFEILATEADGALLERARRGCYPAATLRDLPAGWREAAFTEQPNGQWCVRPELRQGIALREEDLRERMPDGPFDVLLCRNLAFTYFDEAQQESSLRRLRERLAPGGVLVIGGHERLPAGASGLVAPTRHPAVFTG